MSKRTRIFSDQLGYVTVRYWYYSDGIWGKWEETRYMCPSNGGYVRNADTGSQICEKLQRLGDTLHCAKPEYLLALIRREHRKSRRA